MNAQKPPLDDLNARKAVAMAIDLNQVNELRNNGVYTVAHGPFDTSVMGYLKNPGFPKYNPKEAKKLADAYKAGIKAGLSRRYLGEVGRISMHATSPP